MILLVGAAVLTVLMRAPTASAGRNEDRIALGAQAVPPPSNSAVFAPPAHSVAVLPFTNLSGDPGQEYFADGMSEELINALVQVNDLEVVARTSSFSFKDRNLDGGKIARTLNVAAIVEGSVRRSGTTVSITAQLLAQAHAALGTIKYTLFFVRVSRLMRGSGRFAWKQSSQTPLRRPHRHGVSSS